MIPGSIHICVPNLVAVRRSCRKKSEVQKRTHARTHARTHTHTKGTLQLYIVDLQLKVGCRSFECPADCSLPSIADTVSADKRDKNKPCKPTFSKSSAYLRLFSEPSHDNHDVVSDVSARLQGEWLAHDRSGRLRYRRVSQRTEQ